ncbi:hypothetical protein HQ393_00745 [Chitinibacter bivalviorum]|uniref:chitinase n=1 Tax=Chitinibacter bivalviorum TaxID=2739434 RepID=A0A7H9BDU9_9NEIS|nr:glycosyl hydrolase family 18 protein [Chitinibacter bivalviorum]QLG86883.1 hypothetical protein HQ393_00745 [Chitinibacter bivalviorum]
MKRTQHPFAIKSIIASLLLSNAALATDVAPYFYTWGFGNSSAYQISSLTAAKAQGVNAATLAFIINGSNGCVATTDGSSNAITGVMKNDIASYQATGGKLILSFGGANGTYLEAACTADQMVAQIDALIQSSGIKTLDFDVEGGAVGNTAANAVRSAAIKRLQSKYADLKISFTLAVVPPSLHSWGLDAGGLTAESIAVVKSAVDAGVKVNRVNIMAMDYGSYATAGRSDLGQLAIDAATRTREQMRPLFPALSEAQLWDLIGITPMIGINDVAAEVFTPAHAQTVANFAKANGVGLLSYWALQRDQVGKGDLGVYSGVNTSNLQFFTAFNSVNTGASVATPSPSATPAASAKPSATPAATATPAPTATAVPTATPAITSTPKPTPSTTPIAGCAAWDANQTYIGGECVSFGGKTYKAQWWTRGDSPATNAGVVGTGLVWLPLGAAPAATATPSAKPTASPTATATPTATPTAKPSATPSATPTVAATAAPTATPTATPTAKPSVGACNNAAWSSSTAYSTNQLVSYNGHTYQAKWWTQGDEPSSNVGSGKPWTDLGSCNGTAPIATATPQMTVAPVITATPSATATTKPTASATPSATPTAKPTATASATPVVTAVPTATPTVSTGPVATAPAPAAGTKHVGTYFAEWGIYGRSFYVKNMQTSGQASKLTFLNYAFANVFKQADGTYKCDASITRSESGNGDGGDQFAAYGKGFSATDSVDGVGDAWDFPYGDARQGSGVAPLKGNFNQLLKLKKLNPNLKVMISLGGWSWSKWFSAATATDALRKTLVSSCIDQYIKGNLPFDAGTNAGGKGSGAGVFDGIDIDWEYPGVQGVGYNTVDAINDKANQVAFFKELRAQLDAYGASVGKRFYLSTAIGAGLKNIKATDPAGYMQYADWVNIMSYDYNGAWAAQGPTDFQSNLYSDPASPNYASNPDFSTDAAVKNLIANGAPKAKLNVGVPFYGRGWTGVKNVNNGVYQAATGAAKGTYEAGIEDYKVLKKAAGTVYNHAATHQAYKFDSATGTWWSYDTPANIVEKAKYAKDNGLGGVFSWEADGDDGAELVNAMATINQ